MECQKEKSLKHSLTSKREEVIRRQTIELFIKKNKGCANRHIPYFLL